MSDTKKSLSDEIETIWDQINAISGDAQDDGDGKSLEAAVTLILQLRSELERVKAERDEIEWAREVECTEAGEIIISLKAERDEAREFVSEREAQRLNFIAAEARREALQEALEAADSAGVGDGRDDTDAKHDAIQALLDAEAT